MSFLIEKGSKNSGPVVFFRKTQILFIFSFFNFHSLMPVNNLFQFEGRKKIPEIFED